MMLLMQTSTPAAQNNQPVRDLVASSALPPAVALTLFNRGLQPAVSESTWKAFMAEPGHANFKAMTEAQLAHGQRQFATFAAKA
jgi:hypothetical protein